MGAFSGAGSGAATGAATGATVGSLFPGYGTVIGAGVGAVGGGIYGYFNGQKEDEQRAGQAGDIRKRLEELGRTQRAQREMDLQRALAYFGPAQAEMERLYGKGMGGPMAALPPAGGGR